MDSIVGTASGVSVYVYSTLSKAVNANVYRINIAPCLTPPGYQ